MSMSERTDSFIRSTWVIAALTLVSRLLGLARDVLCATVFGASAAWDAFVLAFRIPNLFRRLFGEGALSAAFVPAFTERLEADGQEAARRMAGRIAAALVVLLLVLVAGGEALVLCLRRWAPVGARWRMVLGFTAVLLPYMFFICLTAFAGAVLHSLRHFASFALAPVLLNICWIAALLIAARTAGGDATHRAYIVGAGILAAGFLQLGVQLATLRWKGFRWAPSRRLLHPDVRQMAGSMAPVMLGLAAFQLNVLIDGLIAVGLAAPAGRETFALFNAVFRYPMQAGANSVLYYANRLMQFPLGVFGIALATAVFPSLSTRAARRDWAGFSRSVMQGLRLVIFVTVPASVGLAVLRYPIIRLVFDHGAFRQQPMTAVRTAHALLAYSAAVWAYCALHVLSRAFYGLKRPATPARVAGAMVAVNLTLNLILVWPLREAGLAAATAISAVLQVAILARLLDREVKLTGKAALLTTLVKSVAASAAMAAACWGTLMWLGAGAEDAGIGARLVNALVPLAVGVVVYGLASAALKAEELSLLAGRLMRRRRGSDD